MAEGSDKMVGEINVKDVVQTFIQPDGSTLTALDHVNLNVKAGSFVSFIGPSG